MKRVMAAVMAAAALAALVTVQAQAQAPKALVSGIDTTAFDKTVRPQDDFFRYVNGGWLARTPIPADKASYGAFDMLFDKSQVDLRAIIEEAAKAAGSRGSDSQKIGDFYLSFMDEARVEALGAAPLAEPFKAIDAIRTKAELVRHFARLAKSDVNTPVQTFVEPDFKDPKTNAFFLYQGGLGMPDRDYYLKEDAKLAAYRTEYVAFLTTLFTLAEQPAPAQSASDVMAMETALAKGHWTNVENREITKLYNKFAVADMAREFPGFDWAAWAAEIGVGSLPSVIVGQPSYAKALAAAVDQWPVDRWKPYLKSAVIRAYAPVLSKAFVDARFQFYGKTLQGTQEIQPRWKRAVNTINGNLGEMVGRLYVAKYFPPEAKARMERLVENLRLGYRDGINQLDWMGPETKRDALQKLAAFTPKVGYPDKWRDYSAVTVTPRDLVGNLMSALANEWAYQMGKIGKPVDPAEWGMTPQTVNAYYNPLRNEIVFPAAILQPPFFNMAADDAVNYGGIGAVIGHEMGHGFDDQGRQFDATGTMRDWWTAKDADEYKQRCAQLVAQYAAYEALPGLKVNGELTLGENIGDLTGITIAYRAYRLSLVGAPAPVVDGLSGDQRFFMGWAQVWRGKSRDDALRQQVLTDPHSPDVFRGNGPLGNVPEFYTTFAVKPGDKLFIDPATRVKIW